MKLLVVESPSKAKTINQYLGKDFIVISSYGHIRALPSEEGSVMPDQDFAMHFEILEKSKRNVDEIIKKYKSCNELLLATDPDREGEAISWHLLEALKEKKVYDSKIPIKRVVFNEITKQAVLDAVAHPREINQDLVEAQQARQALDYLVGFTLSPVLWRKLPGSRSAGRVQSVALRIISDREEEIESFKSEEYWTIEAEFATEDKKKILTKLVQYQGQKLEKFSINNAQLANEAVEKLITSKYSVLSVEKKEVKRQPPPPFTTSTMLQEASRKLGFSAKKTSKLAQDLYEGIEVEGKTTGLITYMRTDSVHISSQALDASRKFISSYFGKDYLPEKARFFKNKTKNAQEAHEAIRPTDMNLLPEKAKNSLSLDHYKLYSLIWRRMMASQMSNALLDSVTLDIADVSGQDIFRATGSTIKFDGFLKLYIKEKEEGSEAKEEEAILPSVKIGELVETIEIRPDQHFTEPPPRYTEASLVKKLEELGIGRPSTYPSIIAVLQDRGYVVLERKRFAAVPKGRIVSAFLTSFFEKYVEYDFTAKLEDQLDDISTGEASSKSVLKDFWVPFKTRIDEVLLIRGSEILEKMEGKLNAYLYKGEAHKCTECNVGEMRLKNGRFGPFLGCSNYPNCKHIQRIPDMTNFEEVNEEKASTSALHLPHQIGVDESGKIYTIKSGPYGIYLEALKDKDIKRVKLPRNRSLETIDLNYAVVLASMPRLVGVSEEFGPIKASFGRFGPFVEFSGKYVSIKGHDPVSINLEEAEQMIREKASKPERTKAKKSASTTKAKKSKKSKKKK
jgi:DNA topoisomerase-1